MSSVSSKVAALKQLGWSDELIESMVAADQILDLVPNVEPTSGPDWHVVDSSSLELTLSQVGTLSGKDIELK